MRKFMKKLEERPLVQALFFILLESVAIILSDVGLAIDDDRIAKIYDNVFFIVAPCIYLFLFLSSLVLFASAFLRKGWKRKLLWLCSFANIGVLLLLFFGLHIVLHEEPMLRGTDQLAWYTEQGRRVLNKYCPWCILGLDLLAAQWFIDHIERRIGKKKFLSYVSFEGVEQKETLALQRERRHAAIKVLLGIVAGFAIFILTSRLWVRIDHSEDATIGPCTYCGRPLAYKMIAPGLSIMDTIGSIKPHYLVFDIFFWCSIAWALMFAPDIIRRRARSSSSSV